MLDGEENKLVCVWSEERFRGVKSVGFGGLVFQWWVGRGGGGDVIPCSAGHVGEKCIPIAAIIMYEVGDVAESLVHYRVLEGHGSIFFE